MATGNCENCANRETCKKTIGFMFGYCNTDFIENKKETNPMTTLETLKLKMLALAVELDPYEDPETFKSEINAGPIDPDDVREQMIEVLTEYNDSEYDGDIIALCNDIIRLCDELSAESDDDDDTVESLDPDDMNYVAYFS